MNRAHPAATLAELPGDSPDSIERRRTLLRLSALSLAPLLPPGLGLLGSGTALASVVHALPRVALVIGNSRYAAAPLDNPANDANAIAAVLKQTGFAVSLQLDARKAAMEEAIRSFAGGLARQPAVGLFYFAGHGLQLNWRNFLVPVDAALKSADDVSRHAVDITALLEGLARAKNPMNIIILDACRDNPFDDNLKTTGKGLSQMDAPSGTLLAYATAPGNTASDGAGANGLYTSNLLREMRAPSARIEDVFKRVRLNVRRASSGQQIPWESTSLEDDFYFLPPPELRKLSQEELERQFAEELEAWNATDGAVTPAPIEAYLRRYPSGRFTELALVRLDQMLARQGEKKVQVVSAAANPFSQGTAVANLDYRVGDRYEYRVSDLLTKVEGAHRVQVVTEVTASEVHYNKGKLITDLLGNMLRRPSDGATFGPSQYFATEYSVGRKWSTRYSVTAPRFSATIEMDLHVVGRETITVPAGTFDTFRIEGSGWTLEVGQQNTLTYWVAPGKVSRAVASENLWRKGNRIIRSDREELVSFTPAG
ncbi:MAG: caspase family protein [Gammaproteobacteria bacterium]|nr:caspase family protein [Gammaproteobacteria bacterium]MBU1646053.1 caspase family protein [Gammaproteobacteria bacterium]MBU1972115.1 caspase family protein [Gammaproteobacteria bacterium]